MRQPKDFTFDPHRVKHLSRITITADALFRFMSFSGIAYFLARRAAKTMSEQHRNFHVGALVVAVNPVTGRIGVFFGGVIKKLPGIDPDRRCAERIAIDKALAAGFTQIIGVVAYAQYQPDDVTGKHNPHHVLAPCGFSCRPEMVLALADGTMSPDTRYHLTNPRGRWWRTCVGEILDYFGPGLIERYR